jgi:TP901 family phage tail tape measure protein
MADRSSRLEFILSLTDKVTAPLAKVKMGFSDLAEQGEKNIKQMAAGLGGMWGAAKGITESLEPALEMNRALGEVRSLGVAEDALDALNKKSLEFSVAYGENAQAFVASAYSIEQAVEGLSGSQLATFTNTSNLLAKATKSDTDTMSAYVGTLYNLQKSQADAMGKGAWVEKLGGQTALATQLFRTSGEQMTDAFKEAGAVATTAGVDLAEQMAVIGTLSSTMEGGDAGGRYKAFFENIGAASDKLGMKFVDQQGKLLPMTTILDKLQGKFGDLTTAAAGNKLVEAFGNEGAQVIGALAKDTGRLRNGIEQLGKVRGLENAEKMAQAMVDPWQQFGAAVQALRIAFGQSLLPILTPLMAKLTGIASTIARWTQMFPNLTRVIGFAVLGSLGLAAGISAVTFAVGFSKTTWLAMTTIWKLAKVQATLLNAALLANPITWIVIGVVALVAAVAAAIYYWDDWTTALMNTQAFQFIADSLTGISSWFDSIGGWSGMAKAAWDGIVKIFQDNVNGLIELLNKIPGVDIQAKFGAMPTPPSLEAPMSAIEQAERAQKAQASINSAIPSLSPSRPTAVPQGGLLTSIQNTQNQNKGTHVEKVEIHTAQPMSPLAMENMMSMAVGG